MRRMFGLCERGGRRKMARGWPARRILRNWVRADAELSSNHHHHHAGSIYYIG